MGNINYQDTGLTIQYLQYFLHDNYTSTTRMSGIYDEYTHNKLKEYLDMPNILDYTELIPIIQNVFLTTTDGNNNEQHIYPFQMMQVHGEENTIVFFMKNPKTIKGYSDDNPYDEKNFETFKKLTPYLRTVYDDVYDIIEADGWRIAEYPSMYFDTDEITEDVVNDLSSITVVFKHKTPTNIFPHYDIRYMINYFNNNYINNLEVLSGYFRKSNKYRVALVNCKPNDTFVIAHGYSYSIPFKVGFSTQNENDIKDIVYTSNNNASLTIHKIEDYKIDKFLPGVPTLITVPEGRDYQTMLIVIPYLSYTQQINVDEQTPMSYIDTKLKLGDINNDGEIDEIDRLIYACLNPQDMGVEDGIYYFNEYYDRYRQLCDCIVKKYETFFVANGSKTQYNNTFIYDTSIPNNVANIDVLINHIQFFCSGSNIKFQRSIINNNINYKITIDDYGQAIKNVETLKTNNISVGFYDLYLAQSESEKSLSILNQYLMDNNDGSYDLTKYSAGNGVRIICKSGMSSNNLLVIKTNPDDDIKDCSKILNGIHNPDDNKTLILPISDFKTNPWMVREEFIQAMLENLINPYSVHEDIAYIYYLSETEGNSLLRGKFGTDKFVFTKELKDYLQQIQVGVNSPFALGYFDRTAYSELFKSAYETYITTTRDILNLKY